MAIIYTFEPREVTRRTPPAKHGPATITELKPSPLKKWFSVAEGYMHDNNFVGLAASTIWANALVRRADAEGVLRESRITHPFALYPGVDNMALRQEHLLDDQFFMSEFEVIFQGLIRHGAAIGLRSEILTIDNVYRTFFARTHNFRDERTQTVAGAGDVTTSNRKDDVDDRPRAVEPTMREWFRVTNKALLNPDFANLVTTTLNTAYQVLYADVAEAEANAVSRVDDIEHLRVFGKNTEAACKEYSQAHDSASGNAQKAKLETRLLESEQFLKSFSKVFVALAARAETLGLSSHVVTLDNLDTNLGERGSQLDVRVPKLDKLIS